MCDTRSRSSSTARQFRVLMMLMLRVLAGGVYTLQPHRTVHMTPILNTPPSVVLPILFTIYPHSTSCSQLHTLLPFYSVRSSVSAARPAGVTVHHAPDYGWYDQWPPPAPRRHLRCVRMHVSNRLPTLRCDCHPALAKSHAALAHRQRRGYQDCHRRAGLSVCRWPTRLRSHPEEPRLRCRHTRPS